MIGFSMFGKVKTCLWEDLRLKFCRDGFVIIFEALPESLFPGDKYFFIFESPPFNLS